MTLLVWVLIGASALLIISAVENVPLLATITSVVQGKALPKPVADPNAPSFGDAVKGILSDAFSSQGGHAPGILPPVSGPIILPPGTNFTSQSGTVLAGPGTYVGGAGLTFQEPPTLQGFIGTCVETAGAILNGLWTGAQVTKQGIQNAAAKLLGTGKADIRGATTFSAEQDILTAQGVSTTIVDVGGYSANQLASTISNYVQQGYPAGIGWSNATVLTDTLSGRHYDVGVQGHAGVVEGVDSTGAFIADPNTPAGTPLVHYTWQNLADAQTTQLLVPQTSGGVLP